MALTASSILNKVSILLKDEGTIRRWPVATELLGWLNTAQRDIASVRPDAFHQTDVRQLNEGSRQVLPENAVRLVQVNCNVQGTARGRSIDEKRQDVLDVLLPDWQSPIYAHPVVQYYCYDIRRPKEYFVYPPQPSGEQGWVEEVLQLEPVELTAVGDEIQLDDTFEGTLIYFVLHRAYGKESESPTSVERSNTYRAMALESLGFQLEGSAMNTPGGDV